MLRRAGTSSEEWEATPLTFLTVFCKVGEGGRETKAEEGGRSQRRHDGCACGEYQTSMKTQNKKHTQSDFLFALLSSLQANNGRNEETVRANKKVLTEFQCGRSAER